MKTFVHIVMSLLVANVGAGQVIRMIPFPRAGGYSPPTNGLVAYWPMTGNANDAYSTNHLVVTGATATNGVQGTASTAYRFVGSKDRLTIGDNAALSITGDLTLSAWVWFKGGNTYVNNIVNKYNYPANQRAYYFVIDDNAATATADHLLCILSSQAASFSGIIQQSSIPVPLGRWVHVALVYDAGVDVKFYIAGTNRTGGVISGSVPASLANSTAIFTLGNQGDGGATSMKHAIDEVRVYNRVLTSNEVYQLSKQFE